jgi:hypothetical protein
MFSDNPLTRFRELGRSTHRSAAPRAAAPSELLDQSSHFTIVDGKEVAADHCPVLRSHWLWAALALLGVLLFAAGTAGAADAASNKEDQIKAAFVYNFTKFVEWPAASFPEKDAPIVMGVFGKNPFGQELHEAIKDRKVNGRALALRTIHRLEDIRAVHLLFIPAAADAQLAEVTEKLKGASVLTVGESDAFANAGGMIRFVLEGDKVRFEINMDSAEQAGLKISAQLQKLARAVRRKS